MMYGKKIHKKFNKSRYSSFILAGDVGGTNINAGIFGIRKRLPELLESFKFKSKEIKGLDVAVNETLEIIVKEYSIILTKACFAVAGVVSPQNDFANVTNAPWDVDRKVLLKKTKLKHVIIINDFEAIGYGINMLGMKDIVTIKKAKKIPKAQIVVIGAGTGLGKTTSSYDESRKSYIPLHCEAGHTDFPAQNEEELKLVDFIRKRKKIKGSISYEQVVSGQGLENTYLFLRKTNRNAATKYTNEIDKSKNRAELISEYRKIDSTCKEVFRIFAEAYAKFARNFALDSIALGGVYIAGGIAPKNKEIFDKSFIKLFEDNYMLSGVLKRMPIYLIVNT